MALTLPLWLSASAVATTMTPATIPAKHWVAIPEPEAAFSLSVSQAPTELPDDFQFLPFPVGDGGGNVSPMLDSGTITAGGCQYKQTVDDPHLTENEAGVHGAWKKVGGTCPSKANVDVYLQAFGCGSTGCTWVTLDHGTGNFYAGGGRGKRATAKLACSSTRTVGWRGFVDVDLIGKVDPPGYTYGTPLDLACSP